MKDVAITTPEITVTIAQATITLQQDGNKITLPWQAFAKLSLAVSAIEQAHMRLYRVNAPEVSQ